jgi:hypothetical protein
MRSKTTPGVLARWLTAVALALVLLAPGLPAASSPVNPAREDAPRCAACVHCECCLDKAPSTPSAPLSAPAPQRNSAQPELFVRYAVFMTGPAAESPAGQVQSVLPVLFAATPLYERHCAYLI